MTDWSDPHVVEDALKVYLSANDPKPLKEYEYAVVDGKRTIPGRFVEEDEAVAVWRPVEQRRGDPR